MIFSNMKSRMKGDFHVRFRENVKVKFLCVTRLSAMRGRYSISDIITKKKENLLIFPTNLSIFAVNILIIEYD